MQAIQEKLSDMTHTLEVKADARAEEKAEKEYAKARVGVAHEVRLAREAEADMDKHMTKAKRLAQKEMDKHRVAGCPRSNNKHESSMNSDPGATDLTGAGASSYQPLYAPTPHDLV